MSEMGVYKIVLRDTNEIIYVGKTKTSFFNRIDKHFKARQDERKFEPFVRLGCDAYIYRINNPTQVDIMEKALIDQYKPILNRAYNEPGAHPAIHVDELEWEKFDYALTTKVKYSLTDCVTAINFEINGTEIKVVCHYEYKDLIYWVNRFIKAIEDNGDVDETVISAPYKKYVPLFLGWHNKKGAGSMNFISRYSKEFLTLINGNFLVLKYIIMLNENGGKMTEEEYKEMIDYLHEHAINHNQTVEFVNLLLEN